MASPQTAEILQRLDEPGRVCPVQVHHVQFKTRCLGEMREWYANLLQAAVIYENELMCFLTYDSAHHRIALLGNPELTDNDHGNQGFEHVAFLYGSLDDLLATWKRLGAQGIEAFWTTNHGPSISFYYRDPDGNTNELQADRFAGIDEAVAWFATGDFDCNPIGVDVDPASLLAARELGVPPGELFERSRRGEYE